MHFKCLFFFFSSSLSGINFEAASPPSLDLTDSAQATSSSSVTKETDVKCRLCGIPANARFNPCGHMLACLECASMLRKCFVCKVMHVCKLYLNNREI